MEIHREAMWMIQRTAVATVLGLFLSVSVVGCGGDGSGDAGAPVTTRDSAETTTDPPADTSAEPTINRRFPVGKDGHRLALRCWGDSSPAVVFEAGHPAAGIADYEASTDFQSLVRSLAEQAMVCVYDRAGEGLSVPIADRRRTVDDLVNDLHELLEKAGVAKPYLLVGASFGGFVVVHYAGRYPNEVAGLVLLDVPPPNPVAAEGAPEAHWDHPGNTEHVDAVATERQLTDPLPIEPIPVTIVTARFGDSSKKEQAYWKKLSPAASQLVLEGGHDILVDDPEGVGEQILKTLEASQKGG